MNNKSITIVICTHNRAQWLKETLQSISDSKFSDQIQLSLIIVESACTDNTSEVIDTFSKNVKSISVTRLSEKKPGRSLALNIAFKNLTGNLIALIDDDHVISNDYLINIVKTAEEHKNFSGFCGKILPMWDGSEPLWVHQKGSTAIRPFPVPNFNLGDRNSVIEKTGFIPGAGNLILRRSLIEEIGYFKEELGPKGHNLSGGEDVEYVLRALDAGHGLLYTPDITQYHQVDKKRLKLSYLVKKAFLRHSVLRKLESKEFYTRKIFDIPLFLFKKIIVHLFFLIIHPKLDHKRFNLVSLASQTGEIYGYWSSSIFFIKVKKTADYYFRRAVFFIRKIIYHIKRPRLNRPIFIIGCSRSGTTAVYKTFSESDHLASLHKESHEMWDIRHPASEKNWNSHELTAKDVKPSDRNFITGFYYSHLGVKRLVDKANQNCFRIPYILELFPDAVFVWVKRSGPDNINSLIHGWGRPDEYGSWSGALPEKVSVENGKYSRWCFFLFQGWREVLNASIEDVCAAQWMAANQAILESKPKVPSSQWIEIVYEDFLEDAVKTFERSFNHADIPFDQKMINYCSKLVQTPFNAFSKPRLDKWKDENFERIERVLPSIHDVMGKLGYDN